MVHLPPFLIGTLDEFGEVLAPGEVLPQTSHGVVHQLRTTGPPIASQFRRLDAEKLAASKAEFVPLERALSDDQTAHGCPPYTW